jgi:signal transduction histidine kinase
VGHSEPGFFTPELADRIWEFAQTHLRTVEIGARHAELAQRAVEAEMLLSVQHCIAKRLDLRAALRLVAEEARKLTFAQCACILALDENKLYLEAFSGEASMCPSACDGWIVNSATLNELDGVISPRRGTVPTWVDASTATWLSQRDFLAAPLLQGTQVTELLVVVDKRLGVFDSRDERRLAMLASVSAVCLGNARLYHQAHQVAALQERDRLSRELHDELAQALSYLKMRVSLVKQQISAGAQETAEANLAELKAVLDNVYSSVRLAIFGLRQDVASDASFFATLAPFLADYRAHYELDVALETALDPLPKLAPEVEIQLARIVQEALTNVRRHAAAEEVRVKVEREPEWIVVRIVDDGKGFDVEAALGAEGQRYGLQIMRERAETFDGRVQIESTPSRGSEVSIYIPQLQD